jgi:hypothetical protein
MASRESSAPVQGGDLQPWQLEYESAMKETDPVALFKRIEVAEAAVLNRREALARSDDGFTESQKIKLALANLRSLKRDVLKFS